jgi:hypothetical protein
MRAILGGLVLAAVILVLAVQPSGTNADHTGDLYNCDHFQTQQQAQEHYRQHPGDQDGLDRDEDGVACEGLVDCPCDETPIQAAVTPSPTQTLVPVATATQPAVIIIPAVTATPEVTIVVPTPTPVRAVIQAPNTGDGGLK